MFTVMRSTETGNELLDWEVQHYDSEDDAVEDFRGYTSRETFRDEWEGATEHWRRILRGFAGIRFVVEIWEDGEPVNADECDYKTYREWEAAGFPNVE